MSLLYCKMHLQPKVHNRIHFNTATAEAPHITSPINLISVKQQSENAENNLLGTAYVSEQSALSTFFLLFQTSQNYFMVRLARAACTLHFGFKKVRMHLKIDKKNFFCFKSVKSTICPKGQLISKCPYEKSVSSKIPTKIFLEFCPEIFCSFLGASWGLSQ